MTKICLSVLLLVCGVSFLMIDAAKYDNNVPKIFNKLKKVLDKLSKDSSLSNKTETNLRQWIKWAKQVSASRQTYKMMPATGNIIKAQVEDLLQNTALNESEIKGLNDVLDICNQLNSYWGDGPDN